jgi:hypothetical protein
VTVPLIRIPLAFRCDDIDCRKPLNTLGVVSPLDGRVFCDHICAMRDHIRMRLKTGPHLVPDDIPAALKPR